MVARAKNEPLEPPEWQFDGFVLRPLRHADGEAWSRYLCDPEVTRHTSWGATDVETMAGVVRRCISDYSTGQSCRWALADENDILIGTCGFSNWSLIHSHAELVYDLAPPYWRRGLTSRAVRLVVRWAFQQGCFNRVHAFVMDTNIPSIKLLEQAGFAREGRLRQFRIAHGVARDFFVYSLLASDGHWPSA